MSFATARDVAAQAGRIGQADSPSWPRRRAPRVSGPPTLPDSTQWHGGARRSGPKLVRTHASAGSGACPQQRASGPQGRSIRENSVLAETKPAAAAGRSRGSGACPQGCSIRNNSVPSEMQYLLTAGHWESPGDHAHRKSWLQPSIWEGGREGWGGNYSIDTRGRGSHQL